MSDDHNKRESYYYSYGPFKSNLSDDAQPVKEQPSSLYPTLNVDAETNYEPIKPQKQKRRILPTFAAFMVGVLVMGGLMFASDQMNLFTGDTEVPATQQATSYFSQNNSNSGGVSSAAMVMSRPESIADIVDMSSPAVVKIETIVTGNYSNPRFNDDFFRDFFGDNFGRSPSQERRVGGAGSGFIFEKDGYILTNQHVLQNAEEIYVTVLGHKEPFKAELLGSDYDLDLAVIKIEGDDFPTLPIGNSNDLRVGDWVTAIGNPIGFDHTVSVGVISANERQISIPDSQGTRRYEHLLQTDASINPGNSGGPLLNLKGEVIGINTAVSVQAQGIGFAIPTSTIVTVLDQLKNNEEIPKPYIGVIISDIDETWQKNLELDSRDGSLITQLERGGPASRAGLQAGDVITKVNDKVIKNTSELQAAIREQVVGEKVSVEIIRDGRVYEVAVIIGDRNEQ